MNPAMIFKLKEAKNVFNQNHPKFSMFIQAVSSSYLTEGTVIDITVTKPSGEKVTTNLKLKQSDIELLNNFK